MLQFSYLILYTLQQAEKLAVNSSIDTLPIFTSLAAILRPAIVSIPPLPVCRADQCTGPGPESRGYRTSAGIRGPASSDVYDT
jgi:hypothetical protein